MRGKSKVSGYLLAVFLGFIGAHTFYYGRVWRGVLYFGLNFIVTPIIPMILGWIDTIYLHKWHEQETSGVTIKKKETTQTQATPKPKQEPVKPQAIVPQPTIEQPKEALKQETILVEEVKPPQTKQPPNPPASNDPKKKGFSFNFYHEKNIILDKYAYIKTPQNILIEVKSLETKPKPKKSDYHYISREAMFFADSMKYRYKMGRKVHEVPLKAYYTTFSDLSKEQKEWYFYWRNEVLEGRYPEVDLSYLMLFTYELINYSFNKKAAFNISMMERLHEAYHKRIRQLDYYLGEWIGDMLLEVGENELASRWIQSKHFHRIPALYDELQNPNKPIHKISITTWKPMVRNHRETPFYQEHKKKVHKVFKEGAALHAGLLEGEGNLVDYWFVTNSYRDVKSTFNAVVMVRKQHDVHVYYDEVQPTDECTAEITALYKTSENIVRELNGEKRKLKVVENDLPEGLKEKLEERCGLRTPDVNGDAEEHTDNKSATNDAEQRNNEYLDNEEVNSERFTTVQDSEGEEFGEVIPPQPEEEPKKAKTITFDMNKIRKLQSEQEKMISNVNGNMNKQPTEEPPDTDQLDEVASIKEDAEEEEVVHVDQPSSEPPTPNKTSATILSLFDDDDEIDAEAFIESLSNDEIAFINNFKEGHLTEEEAATFAKQQGVMLGMIVTDLNEKAEEHLGDNLLETQGEFLVIHEEFEDVIEDIRAKGVG